MNKSYTYFLGVLFSFFLVTCCFGEDINLNASIKMPSSHDLAARLGTPSSSAAFRKNFIADFVKETKIDEKLGDQEKSPKEIVLIIDRAFSDYTKLKKNIMSEKKLNSYIIKLTEIMLADCPPGLVAAATDIIPTLHHQIYGESYESSIWSGAKQDEEVKLDDAIADITHIDL